MLESFEKIVKPYLVNVRGELKETKAKKIWVTHGEIELFSRYLTEVEKLDAAPLPGFVTEEED